MAETSKKSSSALIAAAWVVVVVPAIWGLTFTVQNAMKIFARPAAAAPAPVQTVPPGSR